MLARLEATRDEQLAEMGFPAGWPGMELAAGSDARIAEQWSLLQKAAERARRSNTSNGELIRVRMDYNQRALAALQVAVPQKAGFYGPDGRIPAHRSGLEASGLNRRHRHAHAPAEKIALNEEGLVFDEPFCCSGVRNKLPPIFLQVPQTRVGRPAR